MNCKNCSKLTNNKHFCSRSCSATYNNKIYRKRGPKSCKNLGMTPKKLCPVCMKHTIKKMNIVCSDCRTSIMSISNRTKGDLEKQYGKRRASAKIYERSRKSVRELYDRCKNCGYDKHFDICHIKPVRDFSEKSNINEINSQDNLIALCKNCHWEFDNGIISIEDIRNKSN